MKGEQDETSNTSSRTATANGPERPKKAYSAEEKRKEHPRAYAKWTEDKDRKLKDLYAEGKTVDLISSIFQRNRGAINSRLTKLGLAK
jgi:hypothetical protein